jgi:predicted small lipoprotein YifL
MPIRFLFTIQPDLRTMIKLLSDNKPCRNRVRLMLALYVLAALAGCGQKGPLYLPEPAPEVEPAEQAPAAR